jgi:hypothetical protein
MFNQSIRSADYLLFVAIFVRLKRASATEKEKTKRLLFVSLFIVFHLAFLSSLSFAFSAFESSTQVTLTEVRASDTCWVGQPLEISVAAKVEGNDSPMGGITLSFSKPVDIQFVKEDVRIGISKKVYPIGSKVWNQQKKASMASIHQIAELWVEAWPEEQLERFSFSVIPKEAGELEIYLRATVKDAETGEFINAPTQGALDQQGYPCDKRIVLRFTEISKVICTIKVLL